jgi:DMSO/TMAO reductase YedYZ molybdopterin-dependent catalytic subunit
MAGSLVSDPMGLLARLAAEPLCPNAADPGELVGLVPLYGDRPGETPFGEMVGGPGLDARLFTDLSTLEPDRLITPSSRVFVRTAAPSILAARQRDWTIAVTSGDGTSRSSLTLSDLTRAARPMGAHLIECAGNNDPNNFGLMSVAEWEGVPLAEVVDRAARAALKGGPYVPGDDVPGDDVRSGRPSGRPSPPMGILINGIDDESRPSWRSVPGASWVLPLDQLDRLGAFLAIGMNGQPLSADHGAPVRLVVPGWYGCSWIKWVDALRVVGAEEPATPQMREFAARTHQDGVPDLAREYDAPAIDLAATPIRVEKRRVSGRLEYRIVGIAWGGTRTTDRLTIRFSVRDRPEPFAICPAPRTHHTWSLWEYRWRPTAPGIYDIVLKAADPAIRTRRLDLSFYLRRVRIDEV